MRAVKKLLVVTFGMLPLLCKAVVTVDFNYYPSPSSYNISGPADSTSYGTTIASAGLQYPDLCRSNAVTYNLARVDYVPVGRFVGTYQATSAHPVLDLYDSGYEGFALMPTYRSYSFNQNSMGTSATGKAIPRNPQTAWTGSIKDANRKNGAFQTGAIFYIYKGPGRPVGVGTIPRQTVYQYLCYDENNVLQEIDNINYNGATITGSVTGCTPDSPTATIDMNAIPISQIENSAETTLIGTKSYTFGLKCDPNVAIYYSIVDLTDSTNMTTTAILTKDSTATGVGFAVSSSSGTLLKFGPDGSSKGIPNQTKYFLKSTAGATTSNIPIILPLNFSYVRKQGEVLKTGSAKALIGITYSYQ